MRRELLILFLTLGCTPPPTTDLCKGRVEGDLVITELMVDPAGVDTGGEWIEIFNTLGTPFDLKGLTLYVQRREMVSLDRKSRKKLDQLIERFNLRVKEA